MPFANFKFPQGTLNAVQKEEIIHKTTELFAHYFGDGVQPVCALWGREFDRWRCRRPAVHGREPSKKCGFHMACAWRAGDGQEVRHAR
jgi:hypothetical protein